MTTETGTRSATPAAGRAGTARALVRTAVTTTVPGLLVAVLAGLLDGRTAAGGVLVGLVLAVGVLAGGALTLDAVASVMPAAALVVALLTYTLQLLLVLAAFVALEASGELGRSLDRGWLGGTVIVVTMIWLAAQLRTFLTLRLPVYDLAAGDPGSDPGEGGH